MDCALKLTVDMTLTLSRQSRLDSTSS